MASWISGSWQTVPFGEPSGVNRVYNQFWKLSFPFHLYTIGEKYLGRFSAASHPLTAGSSCLSSSRRKSYWVNSVGEDHFALYARWNLSSAVHVQLQGDGVELQWRVQQDPSPSVRPSPLPCPFPFLPFSLFLPSFLSSRACTVIIKLNFMYYHKLLRSGENKRFFFFFLFEA